MTKKTRKALYPVFIITLWLVFLSGLRADIRLPAIIGDHMVIQQEKPIAVWGWAEPGEKVTVRLSGREMNARAGDDGRWRVEFPALRAGGDPLEMVVRGERGPEIAVRDILVGEVWV